MTDKQPKVYGEGEDQYISYPKPDDFSPQEEYEPDHRWYGNKRCQAWSRSANRQCNTQAHPGRDYCRFHGGKSPGGIADPKFKGGSRGGRSATYLKGVKLEDYLAAYEDPDLLSLTASIAHCETEIAACDRRMQDNESSKGWIAIKDIIPMMRKAVNNGDALEFSRLMGQLESIVNGNLGQAMATQEKGEWLALRGSLSTKERQLRLDTKKVVEKERVKVWMGAILAAMRSALEYHIPDQKVRIDVLSKTQQVAIENFGAYAVTDNLLND